MTLCASRRWIAFRALIPCALLAVAATVAAAPAILQEGYDSAVSGANLQESVLTTATVHPASFGRRFDIPVDDNVFAQPLYVPQLSINGRAQNVLFVATMNDTVYAFNADAPGAPLWSVNLARAVGASPVPMASFAISGNRNILGNLGILSTPVIDPVRALMYVVAATFEGGSIVYRLHALDITRGTEPLGPGVVIYGSYRGLTFHPRYVLQRTALVLAGGHVVIGFGALEQEYSGAYSGWVILYNQATLRPSGGFATVPGGSHGGGIWQSGRAPVVDGAGNVYVFTGNGYVNGYDGVTAFGESVLKLSPTLTVLDWFTPHNWRTLDSEDNDLSSSGPMRIPGSGNPGLIAGGGKAGMLYVLNGSRLGHFDSADRQVIQELQVTSGELRGGPVAWQRPGTAGGSLIYTWGSDDFLKAWSFNGNRIGASPQSTGSVGPQPWPGGVLSLSASGSAAGTGILWATAPTSGDAQDHPPVPGAVYAFDAADVSRELWSSNMNASRDGLGYFAKFVRPVVVNGRVYVATQSRKVSVYGLF